MAGNEIAVAVVAVSERVSLVGPDAPDWENRVSPSKNNCTNGRGEAEGAVEESDRYWWERKNEIVNRYISEWPGRAVRPVSVQGGTKLREEAAMLSDPDEESYRSKSWSEVLNEFLKWYNGYRDAELIFKDPEGVEVRGDMLNSHMPEYGDRYYARLKALERQIIREYEEPFSVMLTVSGSSRNANGGWRCPADHLRDVIDSWRPDRGRGVYHKLREVLDGKEWEYALVVEKHKSGYGHVHCAVFVDGKVTESDFHSVIDTHVRVCEIAGKEAHNYESPNEEDRPISVREINSNKEDMDAIGNLGSYVGEYIGSYGESLFDRGLDELVFRASMWATGTQMVRFSTGANEMIERDRGIPKHGQSEEIIRPNPNFDPEVHSNLGSEVRPFEVENPGWAIVGVARSVGDDEKIFELHRSAIIWREIDDNSPMDPPNVQRQNRSQ